MTPVREGAVDSADPAETPSIAPVLAPHSIAVIGAGRSEGGIGNAIVRNLLSGGFTGPVYPVNPRAREIAGLPAFASVLDVPDAVDLAVVAVPAAQALGVVEECAAKGVRGLLVITAGFGESAAGGDRQRELLAIARAHGMRLVGPNCLGIINTDPAVGMNATFASASMVPGRIGFASQSGGLGIALLARAAEQGLAISTFVSLGNKADVSSNDLLEYWEEDPNTDVILLYLESFGNPRKLSRLARRVGRRKPIVALKAGRTDAGARGASSHTAALATPDVAADALFRHAGILRVDTIEELFDVAKVLGHQPLPSGRRVAIVSNGGGPAILAADACVAHGLEVVPLSPATQSQLRSITPPEAAVANPVDLVASATPDTYTDAVQTLLAAPEVDALVVIFVQPLVTRADAVASAVAEACAVSQSKPVVACFLGADQPTELAASDGRTIPMFAFPESAARALARAAEHAAWCQRPVGVVPELAGIDVDAASALVARTVSRSPAGGWLDASEAHQLLRAFGIGAVPTLTVASAEEAARAAGKVGFPVVLKAQAPELVHKTDVGGVRLDLCSAQAVRTAFEDMEATLGARMGGALVQRMVEPGVETIVGIRQDTLLGPLVLFGIGGFATELFGDTAVRLAPLTDVEAAELVRALRASPLLFGYRNTPAVDTGAVEDLLLRMSLLAAELPQVIELDCNPVIVSPKGVAVVDVKVRLAPT